MILRLHGIYTVYVSINYPSRAFEILPGLVVEARADRVVSVCSGIFVTINGLLKKSREVVVL